jgi:hypothetical protein
MHDLVGKDVEVLALETTYKGKLIEIGETEVYLQAESGWISIPVEKIISIVEKEEEYIRDN